MKNTFAIMLMAALMCGAVPAFADHTKEHKAEQKADIKFDEMDTNKDGMVSKAEHDAKGTEMFNEADKNKDGSLSKEEVTEHKKMEMKKTDAQIEMKK